jgi:hypothetical protein
MLHSCPTSKDCNSAGDCAKGFIGQGGSVNINQADSVADGGHFSGSVSNVQLVEWNFTGDKAVPDVGYATLPSATFNAVW